MNKLSNHEIVREESVWGNVTNPRAHNPQKFRYLVHGINPHHNIQMKILDITNQLNGWVNLNKADGDQAINLFSHPERLDQRVSISTSLIDETHHGTWGEAGLIIEASSENILITSPSDAGAMVMSKEFLANQARSHVKLTADNLLQQTSPSKYNEVVVLANHNGKNPKLVGFFYKITANGSPIDVDLYQKMDEHSKRLNLPIVPIIEPNKYAANTIDQTKNGFYVQYGGLRYILRGTAGGEFKVLGKYPYEVFATPSEIETVLKYLHESGISRAEIRELRAEYQKVDKARHQPVVSSDLSGNILFIRKKSGYGEEETETTINRWGEATILNVVDLAKKIAAISADPLEHRDMRHSELDLVSPRDAERIVQEAYKGATGLEKKTIKRWWKIVKVKLIEKWEKNQKTKDRKMKLNIDKYL